MPSFNKLYLFSPILCQKYSYLLKYLFYLINLIHLDVYQHLKEVLDYDKQTHKIAFFDSLPAFVCRNVSRTFFASLVNCQTRKKRVCLFFRLSLIIFLEF
uniref:(northern house mosquito) hypothetical protein n=1 Tax=Culex pipiens TaxID=7175 RepID=A0A8D8I393_CULPI